MSTQRNLLITGGSSYLGGSLILEALAHYDRLFVTTRRRSSDLLIPASDRIEVLDGMDLLKTDALERLQATLRDRSERPIDIIHSVGDFWLHVPLTEIPPDIARQTMESHFQTLYNVAYTLLPLMTSRGGGSIVAFSCHSVVYNYPNMAAYSAAKAAVEALVKCISHEFSGQGIVCNALALSSLQTKAVIMSKPFGDIEHFLPLSEVAETAVALSKRLLPNVNGAVLNMYKHSPDFYGKGYFERNKMGA